MIALRGNRALGRADFRVCRVAEEMPDFEVNEGYMDAGRDRADSPTDKTPAPDDGEQPVRPGEEMVLDDWLASLYGPIPALERVIDPPGASEIPQIPEETPIVRRVRDSFEGHRHGGQPPSRRVEVELIAQCRFLARRACPFKRRVVVLGRPALIGRQLPTKCHGQRPSPPGSC